MPEVCRVEDINPESGKEVNVNTGSSMLWLMLFVRDGEVLAFHNRCPHQGRALNFAPDKFLFTPDGQLMCSHHGAAFKLPEGRCTAGPCKNSLLESVPVTVTDGVVFI